MTNEEIEGYIERLLTLDLKLTCFYNKTVQCGVADEPSLKCTIQEITDLIAVVRSALDGASKKYRKCYKNAYAHFIKKGDINNG